MAQTIKLKRSAQSGASGIPSTSDLALGEVAINTHHGKMYIKKNDGSTESIVEIGSTGSFLPLSGGSLTGSIDVTGSVTADSLTVTGTLGNWSIDSQGVIQTFTRPSANYIKASHASGSLRLQTGGSYNRLAVDANGDISFYNDSGNQGLFFDSSASSLGIGTTSVSSYSSGIVTYNTPITVVGNQYDGSFFNSVFFGGQNENLTFRNIIRNSLSSTPSNQKMQFSVANGASTHVDVMTLSGDGSSVFSGSTSVTGSASANTSAITLGFTGPDGEIKVKNTTGAPAANLDFYTTNSSGTTAIAMRLTSDKDVNISRNLTMDGTLIGASSISCGAITSDGNLTVKGTAGFNANGETASLYLGDTNSEIRATYGGGTKFFLNGTERMELEGSSGNLNLKTGALEINGTSVLDTSRNLTNIGTISSGAITSSGNLNLTSATPIIDLIANANNDSTIRLRENGTGIVGAELIYDGGANQFQFKIGNNSANTAFTIARDTGNVNIFNALMIGSTTAPDSKLTVNTTTTGDGIELQSSEVSIAKLSRTVVSSNVVASLDGVSGRPIHVGGVVNEDVILANAGGNVGIGRNPSYKLDIRNDVLASTDLDPTSVRLYNNSDGGAAILFENGVSAKSKISFGVEGTGASTDETFLAFSTGANTSMSERFRIDSSGNVKIGDSATDITSKLVVSGNASSNVATFMYDGAAGTFFDIDCNSANGIVNLSADARSGAYPPLVFTTGGGERMRIDSSGRLGIGTTSPSKILHLSDTSDSCQIMLTSSNSTTAGIIFGDSDDSATGHILYHHSDNALAFGGFNNTERMRIDSSGRLGISTIPSAWNNVFKAIEIGTGAAVTGRSDSPELRLVSNAYLNTSNNFIYKTSNAATMYTAVSGIHIWSNASVGTAGNTATMTERLRIDPQGALKIGGNSNSGFVDFDSVSLQLNTQRNPNTGAFVNTAKSHASITLRGDNGGSDIRFGTANANNTVATDRVKITSGGNLLIGKSADNDSDVGIRMQSTGHTSIVKSGGNCLTLNRLSSDGSLLDFRKDTGTVVGSIGTVNSNLYLGTANTGLYFNDSDDTVMPISVTTVAGRDNGVNLGKSDTRFKDAHFSGTVNSGAVDSSGNVEVKNGNMLRAFRSGNSAYAALFMDGSENLYIRNSWAMKDIILKREGDFLVGTSSTIPFTFSSGTGAGITNSGTIMAGATAEAGLFNRVGSDGAIIQLYKAGSIVGQIGTASGDITIGTGDTGITFEDAVNVIHPVTQSTGAARDNAIDLGKTAARFKDAHFSATVNAARAIIPKMGFDDVGIRFDNSFEAVVPYRPDTNADADDRMDLGRYNCRWDDVFATNGTIQTSDENEKQDIADLDEIEKKVAVKAKALLKKYRWKSAVEKKGDDARIHFGIIAQDLKQAFESEGLDAHRYGMFCSNTWTDEDGVEQTKMGVRYSELLAFIISTL